MSLFHYENPLIVRNNNELERNSFFDDFENEFFNHPLISFPSIYPYFYRHPAEALENQISKVFNSDLYKSTMNFNPKINLSEDEKSYYIHADLPGLNKEQIKMELSTDNHILTISGERKTVVDNSKPNGNENENTNNEKNKNGTKKEHNTKYTIIESSYGKFERSITIPENADIDNIHAKMENGVLEVNIPKIEAPNQEPKKTIEIQ